MYVCVCEERVEWKEYCDRFTIEAMDKQTYQFLNDMAYTLHAATAYMCVYTYIPLIQVSN